MKLSKNTVSDTLVSNKEALDLRSSVLGSGFEARYEEVKMEYCAARGAIKALASIREDESGYDSAILLTQRTAILRAKKLQSLALRWAIAHGGILGMDQHDVLADLRND